MVTSTEADTNRVSLNYAKEDVAYGVPNTGSAVYRFMRYASDSLVQNTATKKSAEIRNDRNISNVIRTGLEVTGDIVCELSKDLSFEELMESSLQDVFPTVIPPIPTTISITAPNTIADSGSGLAGFNTGDFIIIHSATNGANNRPMRVLGEGGASITVDNQDLITEAASAMVLVQGVSIGNKATAAGTAIDSYSFEKNFEDLTAEFALYAGCTIDGFTIDSDVDGFVNITFHIMGQREFEGDNATHTPGDGRPTAKQDGGTIIAAGVARQFNVVDDMKAFAENNIEYDMTQITIDVKNGHHPRQVQGNLGPKSMGSGTCEVTGSVTMLFADSTQVDKHLAYTTTRIAYMLYNGVGDAYVIEIPSCQFGGGDTVAGGQNQDVVASLPFEAQQEASALSGEAQRSAIRIWKFKV
jgi:hypothetical protein